MVRKCVGGGGMGRQILFLSSSPFPELFRKEGNGKEKKCCGDHSFGEAMNASRIGESAPQPGSSFLWEALGLQGVNSVARELGLSVWLVMDGETR